MSNLNIHLQWMRKVLKSMDHQQLMELFNDMESLMAVEKIANAAYCFLADNSGIKIGLNEQSNDLIDENDHSLDAYKYLDIQSEYEEAKEIDDAQRYRDIKLTNERPY